MNSMGNNVEYKPSPQRTAPFFSCCVDLLCLLVTRSVERDWNVFLEYAIKYSFHILFKLAMSVLNQISLCVRPFKFFP